MNCLSLSTRPMLWLSRSVISTLIGSINPWLQTYDFHCCFFLCFPIGGLLHLYLLPRQHSRPIRDAVCAARCGRQRRNQIQEATGRNGKFADSVVVRCARKIPVVAGRDELSGASGNF